MIKTLIAYTNEIDDAETALRDIAGQMDLAADLRQHSIGIIACHYEFVYSGIAKALCESLPFDVVGTVATAQAIREVCDTSMLTLTILTSDDVEFVSQLTPQLGTDPGSAVEKAYRDIAAQRDSTPALILTFAPFLMNNAGDEYVQVFTEVSGGVPCFGSVSIDETETLEYSFLIFNGDHYPDRIAMILLYGELHPHFLTATISPEKILDKTALITRSDGNILQEVNGRPVEDYFESLGLADASTVQYGMASIPFMLDYGDDTPPISKVFVSRTPEKYAVCTGIVPEGATLRVGVFDKQDVLFTTGEALTRLLDMLPDLNASFVLAYSCVARGMTLGLDSLAEFELIRNRLGTALPFMAADSGGEICPSQVGKEKSVTRFHNNTFIACIL